MKALVIWSSALIVGVLGMGCSSTPVSYVVMQEARNENGFDVHLGYHTTAPFILARVNREIRLEVHGAVVKTLQLSYWEWFKMGALPYTDINWNPEDWARVERYAGEPFFLFDQLRDGPAGLATPPPDTFTVIIESTHALYTGGRMNDEGVGRNGDLGTGGYLATDPQGNGPSIRQVDGDGTLLQDDTPAWRSRFHPQGTIQKPGTKVLTLSLRHVSSWSKNPTPSGWQVDWTYHRTFGGSTLDDQGRTPHGVPAPNL